MGSQNSPSQIAAIQVAFRWKRLCTIPNRGSIGARVHRWAKTTRFKSHRLTILTAVGPVSSKGRKPTYCSF